MIIEDNAGAEEVTGTAEDDDDNSAEASSFRRGILSGRWSKDPSVLGDPAPVAELELGLRTHIGACTCNTGPPLLLLLGRPALCLARSNTLFMLESSF